MSVFWRQVLRLFPTVFTLVLTACSHMPVTSMVQLARVDFQTTDPDKLRVAVKVPDVLKARAEGTVLRVTVGLANGVVEARNFALRAVSEQEISGEHAAGTQIFAFALTARDAAELRLFRSALVQKQKAGAKGSLSIAVQPDACRTAPLPAGPVLVSTYLKTAETARYVPLTRDVDLRTLDATQDIAERIPECR